MTLTQALATLRGQVILTQLEIVCTGILAIAEHAKAVEAILEEDDLAHYAEHHYWRQDYGFTLTRYAHDE